MKKIVLILATIICLSSCVNHQKKDEQDTFVFKRDTSFHIKYANAFNIDYSNPNFTKINITSIGTYIFEDSIFIPHTENYNYSNRKLIKKNYQSLALQSATYIAYLETLGKDTLIKALSGVEYITSPKIKQLITKNNIVEISSNGKVILEKLLKVNPDLFFIYPFELESNTKFAEQGIETLIIDEYQEITPLARLEWLKLFGIIFSEYPKSEKIFNQIEKEYNNLRQPLDTQKTCFFNLPYKDSWAMPSGSSITANLAKDASLNYIYQQALSRDNIILSPENVWHDAIDANFWIIIASRPANYSMNDLLQEEAIYKDFISVKKQNVIFCNTTTTEYFTSGAVEPHIMLSNLIDCVQHKTDSTKYFRILK
jgi:iron complex transport system substrate-binding protein